MSNSIKLVGNALIQMNRLPSDALDALVERVAVLIDEPWDAIVLDPGRDAAYRYALFGEGHGMVMFHFEEEKKLIRIFDLLWAG